MATLSPLSFAAQSSKPQAPKFKTAEDYAHFHTSNEVGTTSMHGTGAITSGPHKGKTRDQVYSQHYAAATTSGLPTKAALEATPTPAANPTAPAPAPVAATRPNAPTAALPPSPLGANTAFNPATATANFTAATGLPGSPTLPIPAAAPPAPAPVAANPLGDPALAAQGLAMQTAGITQRGSNGSVLYANGSSISATRPDGTRQLTSKYGTGSGGPSQAAKPTAPPAANPSIAGPPVPAEGLARARLNDFNKKNPGTLNDAQIAALRTQRAQEAAARQQHLSQTPATPAPAPSPTPAPAPLAAASPAAGAAGPVIQKSTTPNDWRTSARPAAPSPFKQPTPAAPPSAAPPTAPLASRPATESDFKTLPMGANNPFQKTLDAQQPTITSTTPQPIAGARANGGPVQGGQPYLVGERGPEVIVPQQDGTVIPNHALDPRQPMAVNPAATQADLKANPADPNPVEQGILGVVHAGGKLVKGAAGLASMAADSKLREADAYDSGATPHSSFVPIGERYKEDPWYKRIPKQVGDAMGISTANPEIQKHIKSQSGLWASEGRGTLNTIKNTADKEHSDATAYMDKIEPQLGVLGHAVSFATGIIPGVRALDIPAGIGEAKGLGGGIIPTLSNLVTRKIPGSPMIKNAAQQAVGDMANSALARRPMAINPARPPVRNRPQASARPSLVAVNPTR